MVLVLIYDLCHFAIKNKKKVRRVKETGIDRVLGLLAVTMVEFKEKMGPHISCAHSFAVLAAYTHRDLRVRTCYCRPIESNCSTANEPINRLSN